MARPRHRPGRGQGWAQPSEERSASGAPERPLRPPLGAMASLGYEAVRVATDWVTMGYFVVMAEPKSVQRSFRLSGRTVELLDAAAVALGETRNALADRLLGEAVRVERHPLIRFGAGAAGRRQPRVVGTRLDVHQVVATVRANDLDVEATAEYLAIDPRLVRAALDYYAEFAEEVDADAAEADRIAETERSRWERMQDALR